jgi:hypothetical protein
MIIWFNCKITNQRLHPQSIVRYNLRTDDRFDVARYSFASFKPLEPLVTKFIFNLELADDCAGRESEMESWLRSLFPENKIELRWHRCNRISQWQEILDLMYQLGETLIFPAGNEDHVFLDNSIDVFKRGLELIQQDTSTYATFTTSHYPENIRAAHFFNGTLSECGNYATYEMVNNDAIRVIKRDYFKWYLDQIKDPNAYVYRTEDWNQYNIQTNKLYTPTKEQFRHYDGYAHVQIGPDVCPPLEIPVNFFNGMTVKYGFDTRDEHAVNINPSAEHLHTVDHNRGTDYRYTTDTMPAFWQDHVKQLIRSENVDDTAMNTAYDVALLTMTRININWWHVNAQFDNSNWPPANWVNNHTLQSLYYE